MSNRERLKELIDEIDSLLSARVSSSDPQFKAWKVKTERFLIRTYGENSFEHKDFKRYLFTLPLVTLGTPEQEYIRACAGDLKRVKAVLLTYLDEFEEDETNTRTDNTNMKMNRLFIVHGRDDSLRESVARLIEKQGIETVILQEQLNQGRTIIEKFENYSDVGAAICLFSGDDCGRLKNLVNDNLRARQNVVFETGYFIGKLGREKVIIIVESDVELPSDLQGVVYTSTDDWKITVLKELKSLGFSIDLNRL